MRIHIASIFVDDQARALEFYTGVLGFEVRHDVPVGDHRWLTLVAPDRPEGPELLLEPAAHPAVRPFREALYADGIPFTSFEVDDLAGEHARLEALGVVFRQGPSDAGPVLTAVLDDGCGNLLQLVQPKRG